MTFAGGNGAAMGLPGVLNCWFLISVSIMLRGIKSLSVETQQIEAILVGLCTCLFSL